MTDDKNAYPGISKMSPLKLSIMLFHLKPSSLSSTVNFSALSSLLIVRSRSD